MDVVGVAVVDKEGKSSCCGALDLPFAPHAFREREARDETGGAREGKFSSLVNVELVVE